MRKRDTGVRKRERVNKRRRERERENEVETVYGREREGKQIIMCGRE